jgi:mannosyltransferase
VTDTRGRLLAPVRRHPVAIGRVLVVGAVTLGVALRFVATSELWRDEAMTVNIAQLPLGELFDALGRDGHPPLYYLLLHAWTEWFGDGTAAVRSLSAVLSVAALPLAWVAGLRLGGRACATATLVLLATSPFAVRYATEARMYALVVLLVVAGWLAVRAALDRPSPLRLVSVGLLSGLLLLTHYWGLYLVAAVVLTLAGVAAGRPSGERRSPALVAGATLGGLLLFLPWASQFLSQVRHTGTPWGEPSRPGPILVSTLASFGGEFGEALLIGFGLSVLVIVALLGRAVDGHRIELELRTVPGVRGEIAVIALTMALAVVGSYATGAAFAARYASVVFPLFILAAGYGATRLTAPLRWGAVLAVLAGLGLAGSVHNVSLSRTQAGTIAGAIEAGASADDVVVYCPDHLGPAVSRLTDADLTGFTFPEAGAPELVDWVDYLERAERADPVAFARSMAQRAEGGVVWMVWSPDYRGLGGSCSVVVDELARVRSGHRIVVIPNGAHENAWLYRFDPS